MKSSLWPIRYKPLPDELLSSWLVRLAHAHGLKVQTFCNLAFGSGHQVWNRDIDRLAPAWLIDELVLRTDTPRKTVWNTTLRSYEGLLYSKFMASGVLNWILMLKLYHRKRQGFGLQFCPKCLVSDPIPYFRKTWRIAFNTVCPIHGHKNLLHDRCVQCGAAVAIHRISMNGSYVGDESSVACCHACGFDLRATPTFSPVWYDQQSAELILDSISALTAADHHQCNWDFGHYLVMHHLCRIMLTRDKHTHLREFVSDQLDVQDIVSSAGHVTIEMREIIERHHLVQFVVWMMADIEVRLRGAWYARAVRYNMLLKDFDAPPAWYLDSVKRLSCWRSRIVIS